VIWAELEDANGFSKVTNWQVQVRVDGVREVVGILPPKVIDDLLTRIAADIQPPSPSSEGSTTELSKPPESGES
jgi:hypothetical protein